MWMNASQVRLYVDHKSVASTSLERSAVNLAQTLMMTTLPAVLSPANQTPACTVLRASRVRTADFRASVGRGSRGPGVSTPPTPNRGRRRPHLVDRDSASTAADVKRRPTGWHDVCAYHRGLDDIARSLSVCFGLENLRLFTIIRTLTVNRLKIIDWSSFINWILVHLNGGHSIECKLTPATRSPSIYVFALWDP